MYSTVEADKISRVDTCASLLSGAIQASQLRTVSYSVQTHNWLRSVTRSICFYDYFEIPCPLLPFASIVALGAHEDSQRWHEAQ